MKIAYPSQEFDEAVAAVCHGHASDEQVVSLNHLLLSDANARDEYILRLELHSRLASAPDLFAPAPFEGNVTAIPGLVLNSSEQRRAGLWRRAVRPLAIAASVCVLLAGAWSWNLWRRNELSVTTSKAVALLNETAGVRWADSAESPRMGAPLEPGWLKLEQGLAQVVFYSGARVVVEGPAEFKIVSPSQAFCLRGKITAEVPPQARGFRIDTPQGKVTDLGTAFGLDVNEGRTELHVFTGEVVLQTPVAPSEGSFQEGSGAVIESSRAPRRIAASRDAFASLFDLQARSTAAEAQRLSQWRSSAERLNRDPSLIVRFDFDDARPSPWVLLNTSDKGVATGDATLVGCQPTEGRWPGKKALEFQGVSDRVRLNAPGEFDSLALATWVRVHGLDRKLNSLFMCDGFAAGSVHWLIRNDGVMGLTVVGEGSGKYQIVTSSPVVTLDKFGMWLHLAVVIDGRAGRVRHFVNGRLVGENALRIKPPYRIGTAELGNWNADGMTGKEPFMIRNFSGAMDEFCLFNRALEPDEVAALYAQGRPDFELMPPHE